MTDYLDNDIEQIAIIGMSGKFPDAPDIDSFWENLCNGKSSVKEFTEEELVSRGVPQEKLKKENYVRTGITLDNIDMFDAGFFGYSKQEAEYMDPQQRIFLELCWGALEDAGCNPETYEGSIGVFGGASGNDYRKRIAADYNGITSGFNAFQSMLGNETDFFTTRVSYKLNLKGPSLTIQTACSTSLVAVHIACQHLLSYQCDVSLAGGACIRLPQGIGYEHVDGMIWSKDGYCRAFDADASGTVFGHGAGVVALKRLTDALEDRDNIYAVIKGSAINNDGALKVGFTAPSVEGQAEVISLALETSEVEPDTISYIEAHGTGTPLGDPVEIEALTLAYRNQTEKCSYCAIGSLKTNIGHLDAAAGVSSIIKTALSLKNKEIPPTLFYKKSNPNINFDKSPFYVNAQLRSWERGETPRRAGVSSLGIGGTNAHAILEEAPPVEGRVPSKSAYLLTISAKTKSAFNRMALNLEDYLETKNVNFTEAAYTLQTGRKIFNHRGYVVLNDGEELRNQLSTNSPVEVSSETQSKPVVFMFSGQGSQYLNMCAGLYNEMNVFRKEFDNCADLLKTVLKYDLRNILYPSPENSKDSEELINQTFITQPALFAIEYSLAKLLIHLGIKPDYMVGHSIGEYVAACLSGVFSLEDALHLVTARGRLMNSMPPGVMLAVPLSEEEIRPILPDELSLSVINTANSTVVSGIKTDIESFEKKIADEFGVSCRNIQTSHAFHSKMMEPILDVFEKEVASVRLNKPEIPFVSNVTGTWISEKQVKSPKYWADHLRKPVRFLSCMDTLFDTGENIYIEVGPGQILSILSKQHTKSIDHTILSSTRHPAENKGDLAVFLEALGNLWVSGVEINWQDYYQEDYQPNKISLPTYPFERKSYWFDSSENLKFNTDGSIKNDYSGYIENERDRNNNFAYDETRTQTTYESEADIANVVSDIWINIIPGVSTIESSDNFFDIGGTSLNAVQFLSELEKKFNVRLPLNIIYESPILMDLVEIIKEKVSTPEIISSAEDGFLPEDMIIENNFHSVDSQFTMLQFGRKLLKAVKSPLAALRLMKALLIGALYIAWFRMFKRNIHIKFPFYVHSGFKIAGPGRVFIDRGCSVHMSILEKPVILTLSKGAVIKIGKNCSLSGTTIRCKNRIEIGNKIMTAGTLIQDCLMLSDTSSTIIENNDLPVLIGDNVWLAAQSVVLPGSIIHSGVVFGAQTVVHNMEIMENTFAYGNTAKYLLNIK